MMKARIFPVVDARTAIVRLVASYAVGLLCIALAFTPVGVVMPLGAVVAGVFIFYYSVQESLGDDGMALGLVSILTIPCIILGSVVAAIN